VSASPTSPPVDGGPRPPTPVRIGVGFLAGAAVSVPVTCVGAALALGLSLLLHLTSLDAPWSEHMQSGFVVGFAVLQWAYLAPVALFLWRRRWKGEAVGITVTGLFVSGFAALVVAATLYQMTP
jgi:heme/copper-type cytochrome/quinol oxidase subunit 4